MNVVITEDDAVGVDVEGSIAVTVAVHVDDPLFSTECVDDLLSGPDSVADNVHMTVL